MPDPQTLRDLIARVETAKGADRMLDAEIHVALGLPVRECADEDGCLYQQLASVPRYTSSLDAAVSLVPVGWCWWVNSQKFGRCWLVVATRVADTAQSEKCATPALALCAAAFKARVAEMEASDDR